MGIIFRNNRPYGGEPLPDINTYATMEDFESDVPAPEKNHIYIIAGNLYFWDETDQEIKKTPNLNGSENTIPIFDDNNGLKNSIFSYASGPSQKILAAALESGDTLTISGSDGTNTVFLRLKDAAGITLTGISNIHMTDSSLAMIGNSNGNPNLTMQDGSSLYMGNSSQVLIKGMSHIDIGNTNTSKRHVTDNSKNDPDMTRITVKDNAKVDIDKNTQVYLHGGGIATGRGSKHTLNVYYCVPYGDYSSTPTEEQIRQASNLEFHATEYGTGIPSLREIYSIDSSVIGAGFTLKEISPAVKDIWWNEKHYYYFIENYEKDWSVPRGYPSVFDGEGVLLLHDSSWIDMQAGASIHGHGNAWLDIGGDSHAQFDEHAEFTIAGRSHFQMGGYRESKRSFPDSDIGIYEAPIFQMAGNSCFCMNSSYQNSPSIMMSGPGGLLINGLRNDDSPKTTFGPTLIAEPTGFIFNTLYAYPTLEKKSSLESYKSGDLYGKHCGDSYSQLSPDSPIPNFEVTKMDNLIERSSSNYKISKSNYNDFLSLWNTYARYYNSEYGNFRNPVNIPIEDYIINEDENWYYIHSIKWENFMSNVKKNKFAYLKVAQNTVAILENSSSGRSYIKIGAGDNEYTKIFIQGNTHTEIRQNSIFSLRGLIEGQLYWNSTSRQHEIYTRPWADSPYTQPINGSMLTLYDHSVLVMHGVWDTSDFVATDGTVITPPDGWQEHPEKRINSPLVEIIDNAEIRLYGNISVKANTENHITTITFGGTSQEGEVSFTIEELKSLKNLVGSIPTRVITDPEQATENGLLYFIDEEGE